MSPAKQSTPSRAILLRSPGDKMARRRYQKPKPFRDGNFWYLRYWQDDLVNGKIVRRRKWTQLGMATLPVREAQRIADEVLAPLNQGLGNCGSAIDFARFVNESYIPLELSIMASTTQSRYRSVINKYLIPAFGEFLLRDLTYQTIQGYFSSFAKSPLSFESKDKIRDVLASVLKSAVRCGVLLKNPVLEIKIPADRKGKRTKPFLYPAQFDALLALIPEPYATMVYVAIYTGLRVSELAGLRWDDIHSDAITIDERYCRGDWAAPKSNASNATIPVGPEVIQRIQALKEMIVSVRAGLAVRKYRVVKSSAPNDLVFQSVRTGSPVRDNNILKRHIKPAARALRLDFVNWQVLRRSHATWLKLAGADVKDAQAQMRHSRASTTLDIYQQFVPSSQRKVVNSLSSLSRLVN